MHRESVCTSLRLELTSIKIKATDQYSGFNQIDIIYQQSGNTFNLSSLLPEYWEIWETNLKLHTDPERKRVCIPKGITFVDGDMFRILHEFGHASFDELKSFDELEYENILRNKFSYQGIETFSKEEKEHYKMLVIAGEKAAWRFALKKIIDLRKKDIDLEPSMSLTELSILAAQKLSTYLV